MAKMKSRFQDLADELRVTTDRSEQDGILDRWLDLKDLLDIDIDAEFAKWYGSSEARLEPRIIKRKRNLVD